MCSETDSLHILCLTMSYWGLLSNDELQDPIFQMNAKKTNKSRLDSERNVFLKREGKCVLHWRYITTLWTQEVIRGELLTKKVRWNLFHSYQSLCLWTLKESKIPLKSPYVGNTENSQCQDGLTTRLRGVRLWITSTGRLYLSSNMTFEAFNSNGIPIPLYVPWTSFFVFFLYQQFKIEYLSFCYSGKSISPPSCIRWTTSLEEMSVYTGLTS